MELLTASPLQHSAHRNVARAKWSTHGRDNRRHLFCLWFYWWSCWEPCRRGLIAEAGATIRAVLWEQSY